jgi:alanyl-tRNA synthetase
MTERLYYRDANLLEFEAIVVDAGQADDRCYTVLNRSAFYPTSGGQLHDTGFLNGVEVVEVLEDEGDVIRHITPIPVGQAGDTVKGVVNATRRRRLRQQHTAQHILSQVFIRLCQLETVSVHLGEDYGAVELGGENVTAGQLEAVEEEVDRIIVQDLPVEVLFVEPDEAAKLPLRKMPERQGKFRIVRIGEFDYSACGGTHCDSTAGVRLVKIVGTEKMRGRAVVKFLAGDLAVGDYRERFRVTAELSHRFTCHFNDLPDKTSALEADEKALRKELAGLQKELLPAKVQALAQKVEAAGSLRLVATDVGPFDNKLLGMLAGMVAQAVGGLALLQSDDRLVLAVSETTALSAGELVKQLCEKAGLRGGGGRSMAQVGGAERGQVEKYRSLLLRVIGHE